MDKEYTGLEIMNMIAKGEIKKGDKFEVYFNGIINPIKKTYVFDGEDFVAIEYIEINVAYKFLTNIRTLKEILKMTFKRISDKIDIQAIEELNKQDSETMNEETITEKINELIKAVKYLDKKEG